MKPESKVFDGSCKCTCILILLFQVLVVSADPQMTLGVVDLVAKDTTGEDAGTVEYELIKDG